MLVVSVVLVAFPATETTKNTQTSKTTSNPRARKPLLWIFKKGATMRETLLNKMFELLETASESELRLLCRFMMVFLAKSNRRA